MPSASPSPSTVQSFCARLSTAIAPYLPPEEETSDYSRYVSDLAGFGREILGEDYTPDQIAVFESVVRHRVTLVRSANGVGKTHLAGALAWAFFRTRLPTGVQVHLLAAPPLANLQTKTWGETLARAARHPELMAGCRKRGMSVIRGRSARGKSASADQYEELDFIRGIPIPQDANPKQIEAAVAGSHRGSILYVVDEGDGVPKAVFDAIESCLSGGEGHLVIFFNPREEGNYTYDLEAEERAFVVPMSAFGHPNVITGEERIPGAVTRETTVRRILEWTEPTDSESADTYVVPDFLVGCVALGSNGRPLPPVPPGRRRIVDTRFAYMVLGRYDSRGSNRHVFPRLYLSALAERMLQRDPETQQRILRPVREIEENEGQLSIRLEVYEEPIAGVEYVAGADVAKGLVTDAAKNTDRDFCELSICRRDTGIQVAAGFGREHTSPELFALDLHSIGLMYNGARLIVENNSFGRSTIAKLVQDGYPNLYWRKPPDRKDIHEEDREYGFETTGTTKPLAIGYLESLLRGASKRGRGLYLRSLRHVRQCSNYGHLAGGAQSKMGALSGHDDGVTANFLCAVVLVEEPWIPHAPPQEEQVGNRYGHLYGRR